MDRALFVGVLGGSAVALALVVACGSDRGGFENPTGVEAGVGFGNDSGGFTDDASLAAISCEEAKTSKSYVGCDYWPTVTPNAVWSIFDYAVVVANTGTTDAAITVTGPNGVNKQTTVAAGELSKVYLPWVSSLKGPDADPCGSSKPIDHSLVVEGGAYHLVSSVPVTVYQFNALEYKGEGGESPNGGAKDWSSCPGNGAAATCGGDIGCFSYSNDASLLLPSTAMTNNYRVTAFKGIDAVPFVSDGISTALTVTSTQPDTEVVLTLSSVAGVTASVSGQTIPATSSSGKITVKLANAGDVAEFVGTKGKDFSGSLVQSDKPVQVIASVPCITIPAASPACDHIEETVLPAETLGKHYVVAPPTGPKGSPVKYDLRLYGNKDGTQLTYNPSKPDKCPDTLDAGQVVDCDIIDVAFEVTGTNEFGIATFLLGATVYQQTLTDTKGDPSQSTFASVEQFRTNYVFLAPKDYPVLWADVTAPEDAQIVLDGLPIPGTWGKIGAGPFGIYRVDLTQSGKDGAHVLTSQKPVGVQVIGFGDYTSFQYPAGLNLTLIAPPPPR